MAAPSPAQPVASVLVVDDDVGVVEIVAAALSEEGFQVAKAFSGADALKLAREIRFDVVLCDLRMAGLSGEDTLASLKAIDPEIEVVMGTGHATVDTAVECMRRGAFDYLEKPYNLDTLFRVIRRALEYSRLHGAVELSDASRAIAVTAPEELPRRLPEVAAKLFRADAAALVIQRATEFDVSVSGSPQPSSAMVRALAVRGVQTPAPFRFVSPRSEGIPMQDADDAFAAGLVCPLRTATRNEGALVLLRRQGSPPFSIAVVRRAMTFASLAALAVAAGRSNVGGTGTGAKTIPEAVARLMREARQGVDALARGSASEPEQKASIDRLAMVVSALEKLLATSATPKPD